MAARTLAVQVSEELFQRFKERFEKEKIQRPGRFTQKDYLIEIITQALDAADESEQSQEDLEEEEESQVTGAEEEQMDEITPEANDMEDEEADEEELETA